MSPSPAFRLSARRLLGLPCAVAAVAFLLTWSSPAEGPPRPKGMPRVEDKGTPARRAPAGGEKAGPGYLTSRPRPAATAEKPTPAGTTVRTGERQRRRLRLADG